MRENPSPRSKAIDLIGHLVETTIELFVFVLLFNTIVHARLRWTS